MSNGFMLYVVLILLSLLSSSANVPALPGCKLSLPGVDAYFIDGDFILGAVASIHTSSDNPSISFTRPPQARQCVMLDTILYQEILTLVFGTEEINMNPFLLINITLGFNILDSCCSEAFAVERALWLLSGGKTLFPNYNCEKQKKLSAIVAEAFSSTTVPVARLLGIYRVPQISHAAGLPLLSDKRQFPSFLRTAPHTYPHGLGLAEFVIHFGWAWIGVLYADDDFNIERSQELKKALSNVETICLAYFIIFPANLNKNNIISLVETVLTSSASVVIIFSYGTKVALIMEEMSVKNVTGKVWIASSGWIDDAIFSKKKFWKILNGTVGYAQPSTYIPGLKDFLHSISPYRFTHDIYMKPFWETAFSCKWLDNETMANVYYEENTVALQFCTGKENLELLGQNVYPLDSFKFQYNMLNAVYAIAHALHNLQLCSPGEGPFSNRTCADKQHFQPWQLLHYIKNVHFTSTSGEQVYFDENGDVSSSFDIINWQLNSEESMRSVTVGRVRQEENSSQSFIINDTAIMWSGGYTKVPTSVCSRSCHPGNRKAPIQGMPVCCYECVPCSDGEIANETDADTCIQCPDDSWPEEKKTICNLKHTEYLSWDDPLGAALTVLAIFLSIIPTFILWIFIKYRDTPIVKANNRSLSYFLLVALILCFLCSLIFIGKPHTVSCLLRQSTFGITFAVCVSLILAKTITVVIVFGTKRPGGFQQKCFGSRTPSFTGCFCALLQLIVCTIWFVYASPFPEKNLQTYKDKIILECNEGSSVMFYFMLGYLGLLASICFMVAFLVRKLPDRYNEAKFITFSMLIFVSVWLSFIPAYLSTKGKYVVAVEIFAIISSGFGLLGCIFFPKCYIILLRPDQNIRESVAWKSH